MFNDALYECPHCHSTNILSTDRRNVQTIACTCGKEFTQEEGFCQLLLSSDPMILGAVTSQSVIFNEVIISEIEPVTVKLPHKIWRVRQILTEPSDGIDTCFIDHDSFCLVVTKERLDESTNGVKIKWYVFANLTPPTVLWAKLLGDAFEYHFKEAFDIAIIYAITALDTELSEFTQWLTTNDRATLSDKIDAFTQAIGQNERNSLKDLIKGIRNSIKIRNRLIHDRKKLEFKEISWQDSINTITNVYQIIKHTHRIFGNKNS